MLPPPRVGRGAPILRVLFCPASGRIGNPGPFLLFCSQVPGSSGHGSSLTIKKGHRSVDSSGETTYKKVGRQAGGRWCQAAASECLSPPLPLRARLPPRIPQPLSHPTRARHKRPRCSSRNRFLLADSGGADPRDLKASQSVTAAAQDLSRGSEGGGRTVSFVLFEIFVLVLWTIEDSGSRAIWDSLEGSLSPHKRCRGALWSMRSSFLLLLSSARGLL